MANQKFEIPKEVFALFMLVLVIGTGAFAVIQSEAGYLVPQGKNLFFSVLIAIGFGLVGFLKNTKPEDFDPVKFLITIFVSILAGLLMFYMKYNYATAADFVTNVLVNTGILVWIEYLLKMFVRRLSVLT